MKKSILILGRQASGKTNKLKNILLSNKQPCVILPYQEFELVMKSKGLKSEIKNIGIDDIISVQQLDEIVKAINETKIYFVVATQLDVKELPANILSTFEIINCNAGL